MELLRVVSLLSAMLFSHPTEVMLPETTLSVAQQENPTEVNDDLGMVTQFSLTDEDTVGLLAHNYKSGIEFEKLEVGDIITMQYEVYLPGDDSPRQLSVSYEVFEIIAMQAFEPSDPESPLLDLRTHRWYSVSQVHHYMYVEGDGLTLQTCIEKNGMDNWGRLFVRSRRVPQN